MSHPARVVRVGAGALTSLLVALALGSCASSADFPTGAIAITLKPGDTGSCITAPCQVSLVMPPGQGSYEVTGNQVRVGTYPAGQTVNLGGYYESQKFVIVGAKVAPAYVYVPNQR
ncbi:MAG: hypothetical protein IPN92_00655 [Chromatiaceae bacterium]|nr:hypothetical protein [Chromatiaceae bacterium]